MVHEEASRCGKVLGIAVPTPPDDVADDAPCRVYVRFANADDAAKCKRMMHGRKFDDNEVRVAPLSVCHSLAVSCQHSLFLLLLVVVVWAAWPATCL